MNLFEGRLVHRESGRRIGKTLAPDQDGKTLASCKARFADRPVYEEVGSISVEAWDALVRNKASSVVKEAFANPATVACDILKARGEPVDRIHQAEMEAICEEPVTEEYKAHLLAQDQLRREMDRFDPFLDNRIRTSGYIRRID